MAGYRRYAEYYIKPFLGEKVISKLTTEDIQQLYYMHGLDRDIDLKQEAIATIEDLVRDMDEGELLHHSRPLAIAYLALTDDAADVVPVVHGRWVYHDDGVITCSECGNAESSDSYYCRYCGAKMDGEP